MKTFIAFIFGKPYREKTFFIIYYWFGVSVYPVLLVWSVIGLFKSGTVLDIPIQLIAILGYPLLFRLVYGGNVRLQRFVGIKGMKIFIIYAAIFVITAAIVHVISISGDGFDNGDGSERSHRSSTATFTSKSNMNGDITLSVGSLKGFYKIENFVLKTDGKIIIPYEASVETGNVKLQLLRAGDVIWESSISPTGNGVIDIDGSKGGYSLYLDTEAAKKINVKVKLK